MYVKLTFIQVISEPMALSMYFLPVFKCEFRI